MMASSPSHRATQSISRNLQTPGQGSTDSLKQQRRMTSPIGSLALPDGGRRPSPRPPSPLRNGFILDSSTGIDPHGADDGSDDEDDEDDDDPAKWHRSPSPASSVSHLAASFVQRMNNFVGGMGPKSPSMLSDAELEAEAERERDRSRREAEAILTREAQQRKLVEERVLAMVESAKSLPPPPSLSQSSPNPPSPSNSQKETNWWTAAKNKLTPSKEKEPLTPAQQVIQDAKTREKEKKNGKGKEKEWPSNAQRKFSDPAYANLNIPVAPPQRKPVPAAQPSPPTTPSRPTASNLPPNLTPSPMRSIDNISTSPSREAPPLYAQFNAQGALDVPGTLLTIAKRFEKLEKWTVGHVRALEERMNDVEKWLVDKEKEKADSIKEQPNQGPQVNQELSEIKEEIVELQGRVGELGREMAKLAAAPARLSSGPATQTTSISPAPQTTTSTLVEQHTGSSLTGTPHRRRISSTALSESTSPPLASNKTPSGTRLPYPQGDYTSPPDAFSPPNSPPGSLNAARRTQALSISGLPSSGPYSSTSMSYSTTSLSSTSSYGRTMSPAPMSANPAAIAASAISPTPSGNGTSSSGLPPPKQTNQRQSSVSPTPRKRYTVALGGPIVAPDNLSSNAAEIPPPKRTTTQKSFIKSANSLLTSEPDDDDDEEDSQFGGETIGKSAAARMASSTGSGTGSLSGPGKGDYKSATTSSPSPMSSRRLRPQSAYGFSSIAGASGTTAAEVLAAPSVAPLRTRAKSSERLNSGGGSHHGTGDGMVSSLGIGNAKFVDPLVLRKQSKDALAKPIAMPKPMGKVPIGQLVAFFDKDKK